MRQWAIAAVLVLMFAGAVDGAAPPTPATITNATGNFWVNHTWWVGSSIGCMTGGWGLITGGSAGDFEGYSWNGSAWDTDSSGTTGLPIIDSNSAPTIFQIGDTWYLISGRDHYNQDSPFSWNWYWEGIISGYHWTGSAWTTDSAIISGISDGALCLHPSTFEMGGIHHLIIGDETGTFDGYHWTGSAWTTNASIVSGLGDVGSNSAPTIFQMTGTWYLISGETSTNFNGYHWTGSAWTTDSGIITGLGAFQDATPSVFQKDGTWYLVNGKSSGDFNGYHWTGSAWTTDSAIISGLVDVGSWSSPSVMYLPTYDTDSYNVSVNGTWYNGTTDTYYTDTYSPHVYQNTTVYAYNNTVGISEIGTSQNTQIPNNPTVIIPPEIIGFPDIHVDYDATDADGDTLVFSCSRPDLFTDFNSVTGEGNWIGASETYFINFSVSDGWGSSPISTLAKGYTYPPQVWWDGDWMYRQRITINSTLASNLNNSFVPVFVNASRCWWNDCSDMRFIDAVNGTEIDFYCDADIGGYPNTTTSEKLYLQIPNVSSGDDAHIDFYFGNGDSVSNNCSGSGTLSFTEDFEDGVGYLDRWYPSGYWYGIEDYGPNHYFTAIGDGTFLSHTIPYAICDATQNGVLRLGYYGNRYALIQPAGGTLSFKYHAPTNVHDAATILLGCTEYSGPHVEYRYDTWGTGTYSGVADAWNDGYSHAVNLPIQFCACVDYSGSGVLQTPSSIDDISFQQSSSYTPSYMVADIETAPNPYIIIRDTNKNMVNHAQVTIQNMDTSEIVYKWLDVDDGVVDMGHTTDTYRVAVRTFDGVFVDICDLSVVLSHEITIPIHYNLKVYPVDEYDAPLSDVFAGLAEYTPLNPGAFWGMDLSDRGYVAVTNCSGFAMCDIIAEKEGYADYKVEALNWTSKSALVKDYRHNIVMEEV